MLKTLKGRRKPVAKVGCFRSITAAILAILMLVVSVPSSALGKAVPAPKTGVQGSSAENAEGPIRFKVKKKGNNLVRDYEVEVRSVDEQSGMYDIRTVAVDGNYDLQSVIAQSAEDGEPVFLGYGSGWSQWARCGTPWESVYISIIVFGYPQHCYEEIPGEILGFSDLIQGDDPNSLSDDTLDQFNSSVFVRRNSDGAMVRQHLIPCLNDPFGGCQNGWGAWVPWWEDWQVFSNPFEPDPGPTPEPPPCSPAYTPGPGPGPKPERRTGTSPGVESDSCDPMPPKPSEPCVTPWHTPGSVPDGVSTQGWLPGPCEPPTFPPVKVDPTRYVRVNGFLKSLPSGNRIIENRVSGDPLNPDYIEVTRAMVPWFASMGIELAYGPDYQANLRSKWTYFGTPNRVIASWPAGEPSAPSKVTHIDFDDKIADDLKVRRVHVSDDKDLFGVVTLFNALGAVAYRNPTDRVYEIIYHPEQQVTGWWVSCINHGVTELSSCPRDRFVYNMLWKYYQDVAKRMGLPPDLQSPLAYHSLLYKVHNIDESMKRLDAAQIAEYNSFAISYEAADYRVWEVLNQDAMRAAVYFAALYEVVTWANQLSYYYPDPAEMYRAEQAMQAELERQQGLAGMHADRIRQALERAGLTHDLPVIVAPYKGSAISYEGPAIVVRWAPPGSKQAAGLNAQARSNGAPIGRVPDPDLADYLYTVETLANGVAVDSLATVDPSKFPNLPPNAWYVADTKIGYAFMFTNRDFKTLDPRYQGIFESMVKKSIPRLVDVAEYLKRTTGKQDIKAAIYHPNKDFIDYLKAETIKVHGQKWVEQNIVFLWSPTGKNEQLFQLVNFNPGALSQSLQRFDSEYSPEGN